jgi:hypothetical protein
MVVAQKQREVDFGRTIVSTNQAVAELNTFLVREGCHLFIVTIISLLIHSFLLS